MDSKPFSVELEAKPFPIIAGKPISILHKETANALGLLPLDRIEILNEKNGKSIVTVVDMTDTLLERNQIGLFESTKKALGVASGDKLRVYAIGMPKSVEFIKKKMRGEELSEMEIRTIVEDFDKNRLSDIEGSAFMTAVYIHGYSLNETVAMIRALTENGLQLRINKWPIVDKHSIGGINGRATMIVVPIVAAAGLFMPKTSSRSITSAAGTADAMEVLANVCLGVNEIKSITESVGGIIAWGGAIDLAPVDDKIIKIEHPLSLDPPGQVIASVMAKKASVGSKFVVIDIPVGPGMKIKNVKDAHAMGEIFLKVGKRIGIDVEVVLTDGTKPSGYAFGPALEAKNVMEVLEGKRFDSLAQKSCELAGVLFELVGKAERGHGVELAKRILESGKALKKMKQIIDAQGKRCDDSKEIELAEHKVSIESKSEGEVSTIDVKHLINIARTAGAPADKKAGVKLLVDEGTNVSQGDVLYEIYAENKVRLKLAEEKAMKYNGIHFETIIIDRFP
jgi:AMP phosphorylase